MRISDFLNRDFVLLDVTASEPGGVLQELADAAARAGIGEADAIRDKLAEREESHSTSVGEGIAIPHATLDGLAGPVVGLAVSKNGVAFGTSDSVHVFFVLLSPPGRESDHVRLLGRICRLGRRGSELLGDLTSADGMDDLLEAFEAFEDAHA